MSGFDIVSGEWRWLVAEHHLGLPRSGLVRFFPEFRELETGPLVPFTQFRERWTGPPRTRSVGPVQVQRPSEL